MSVIVGLGVVDDFERQSGTRKVTAKRLDRIDEQIEEERRVSKIPFNPFVFDIVRLLESSTVQLNMATAHSIDAIGMPRSRLLNEAIDLRQFHRGRLRAIHRVGSGRCACSSLAHAPSVA